MTVEISPEAYRTLQQRVEQGQFASIQDALNACIESSASFGIEDTHDPAWLEYLDSSIEEGLRSAAEEPLILIEEVLEDLRKRRTTAA